MKSEIKYELPKLTDHPILLWFRQQFRKLTGKEMFQLDVLEDVVEQASAYENIIGVLLFGSVASRTHKWRSDLDLIFIYENHTPPSGLVNYFVSGIEVQYFYATLDTLVENKKKVPYLLHMFSEGQVLFDRYGTVAPVVKEIRQYYTSHPEIEEEWLHIKNLHQIEKRGSACQQTTIMQRWDELEEKYSGGERKRTFFLT